jgi:hypothetical protein
LSQVSDPLLAHVKGKSKAPLMWKVSLSFFDLRCEFKKWSG